MKKKSQKMIDAKKFLLKHPNNSITQVAKEYNIDRGTLGKFLQDTTDYSINGHDGYWYYFEKEEKEIIEFFINNPKISMEEVMRHFPKICSKETLKRWVKIVSGSYSVHSRYGNNKNAFAEIKTEEDAYWLGFITADGYVCESQPKVVLGLGEIDFEHLRKYASYLGYTDEEFSSLVKKGYGGAYTRDNVVYSLTTCGKQIVQNLVNKNVRQRKSGKEVPYICLTEELQKAYIRGLFDGDGYIRTTQFGIGLVGSLEMMTFVRNFLDEHLNWNDEKTHIYEHGTIYKYAISGRNKCNQILHFLYDDATIYLNRKYNLYKTYVAVDKSRD